MKKPIQTIIQIPEPPLSTFFFADSRLAFLWLLLRIYIGWQWIQAGYEKILSPLWVGRYAGGALDSFLVGAMKKSTGLHPDVSGWYGYFLQNIIIPHTVQFSYVVSFSEFFVGIALIFGVFTGGAAFLGGFMNMNYLFAGTISINPFMFLIELFLILAWRVAGYYGIDHFLLPLLGTPWQKGTLLKKS